MKSCSVYAYVYIISKVPLSCRFFKFLSALLTVSVLCASGSMLGVRFIYNITLLQHNTLFLLHNDILVNAPLISRDIRLLHTFSTRPIAYLTRQ